MLVLLPRTNNHIYAIDLERVATVLIVNADKRNNLYKKVPERRSSHLPVVNKYLYVSAYKVKLAPSRQKIKRISAFTLKQKLLEITHPFIIEEPEKRYPREIFKILSSINFRLHTYYTVTYTKVYSSYYEPANCKSSRFIIAGPAVVFL